MRPAALFKLGVQVVLHGDFASFFEWIIGDNAVLGKPHARRQQLPVKAKAPLGIFKTEELLRFLRGQAEAISAKQQSYRLLRQQQDFLAQLIDLR